MLGNLLINMLLLVNLSFWNIMFILIMGRNKLDMGIGLSLFRNLSLRWRLCFILLSLLLFLVNVSIFRLLLDTYLWNLKKSLLQVVLVPFVQSTTHDKKIKGCIQTSSRWISGWNKVRKGAFSRLGYWRSMIDIINI